MNTTPSGDELYPGHVNHNPGKILELLNCLQEECAEVIQAISKIKRHGFLSKHPFIENSLTNQEHLMKELGDVDAVRQLLEESGVISPRVVEHFRREKLCGIHQWLHHHNPPELDEKASH